MEPSGGRRIATVDLESSSRGPAQPAIDGPVARGARIAEVVYQAATDGEDRLRYIAGSDAKQTYALRTSVDPEIFRRRIDAMFFG